MASHGGITMTLLLLAAAVLIWSAEAQSSTPSCASKLVPCAEYMNSTNPPSSCCDPIKEAVATDRACLCNLYNTPGLLQSFRINVTQALRLTQACGVDADTTLCSKEGAPSPASGTPPGVPGNDAAMMLWTGLPGLVLVWVAMLLY